ncbi:adenylate/guanylate cyclase domain-containing protein [Nodosilinea sp. PGN35]|uniref:adenylate/guanylate cyclase domain-containing protein n=1 Tax=Nodosilinea sp. PGN35 TaxID=3020489 RepID=UPI0023B2F201|nr:adenylate/guanylate cyclase domain-containing protein [Nodosilinea sp. TSF1-S3]MDF0366502.1 adenylate/guanylate cyclase domain-containing protein [Nodosilinea sp. TSF1-S3]
MANVLSSVERCGRGWPKILAVAAGYFIVARLSLHFMELLGGEEPVLPIWPPAGYSQGIVLVAGAALAPGITLGSLLFTLLARSEALNWHWHLVAAVNNTLQPLIGLWLLRRVGFLNALSRLQDVGAFIGLGAVTPAIVSATVGITYFCLTTPMVWGTVPTAWFSWWISNVTGVVLMTSLIITWPQGMRRFRSFYAPPLIGLWLAVLIALSWYVFCSSDRHYYLSYMLFPVVMWAALRLGPFGAALGSAIVTAIATWGIFQAVGSAPDHSPALLHLQAYICVLTFTALILAGVVAEREQARQDLQEEKEKSEQLLLNILPLPIATRLKQGRSTIADHFAEVTVLFADIVEFTQLSETLSPQDLVALLNDIFSQFDQLAERHQLEKIKTIGDAYMAVGGIPYERDDHAQAVAAMALDMQAMAQGFSDRTGQSFRLRIGINTGPVVAGVIGTKKFIYDLWGDTVNTASRMESFGLAEHIQVTETTYNCLKDSFDFDLRGEVPVKGKGTMRTYFLRQRSPVPLGKPL